MSCSLKIKFQILVINDGSTDHTLAPNIAIAGLLAYYHYKVINVEIPHHCRKTGNASKHVTGCAHSCRTITHQKKIYALVDRLSLRQQPGVKSTVIGHLGQGQGATYLNEKSSFTTKYALKGNATIITG